MLYHGWDMISLRKNPQDSFRGSLKIAKRVEFRLGIQPQCFIAIVVKHFLCLFKMYGDC